MYGVISTKDLEGKETRKNHKYFPEQIKFGTDILKSETDTDYENQDEKKIKRRKIFNI